MRPSNSQHDGEGGGWDTPLLIGVILCILTYIAMVSDARTYLIAREPMVVTAQTVESPKPSPPASIKAIAPAYGTTR